MLTKDREVLLENYLKEAVERFQKEGGILPDEACISEIIIGATEQPVVAARLLCYSAANATAQMNMGLVNELSNIMGYIEASLVQNIAQQNPRKINAFAQMDIRWLHGTYKKTGGGEYMILGSSSYTSIHVMNVKTKKIRNIPREEAGKAIAENGLTTKNGEFIPPTASRAVMQSIKEIELGNKYREILTCYKMRGKGDVNNIGRMFNDGKKCVGTFVGAKMAGGYQWTDVPGVLYIKRLSDGKIVSKKITGADDPEAYVVDDAGVKHLLFQ